MFVSFRRDGLCSPSKLNVQNESERKVFGCKKKRRMAVALLCVYRNARARARARRSRRKASFHIEKQVFTSRTLNNIFNLIPHLHLNTSSRVLEYLGTQVLEYQCMAYIFCVRGKLGPTFFKIPLEGKYFLNVGIKLGLSSNNSEHRFYLLPCSFHQ